VCSSSPPSASDTDNEQTQDSTQNAAFSSDKFYNLQCEADYAGSEDEAQYSTGTEGTALPRPAWMDSSSQDGSVADARVQSIRDIIRVSDRTFKHCVYFVFFVYVRCEEFRKHFRNIPCISCGKLTVTVIFVLSIYAHLRAILDVYIFVLDNAMLP